MTFAGGLDPALPCPAGLLDLTLGGAGAAWLATL